MESSVRVCVVTGATAGIGRATALELTRRGCVVWAVCRNADRAARLADESEGDLRPVIADLGELAGVRRLADRLLEACPRIHLLVNNAAVVHDTYGETADGLERQWAVNHCAPFLLTTLLLPRLRASAPARVLTVTSRGHALGRIHFEDLDLREGYGALRAYRQSKLANVLFTRELARRLEGTGVTALCAHPGEIATDIGRTHTSGWLRLGWALLRPFQRPAAAAGAELADLGLSPRWEGHQAAYFSEGRPTEAADHARDAELAARLWTVTERLVGVH